MTVYDKGDAAVLTVTFKDAAETLIDPEVVKFRAVDPAGTTTNWTHGVDAEITHPSLGVFVATLEVDVTGVWSYHWTTEAGTVESGEFEVVALSTERVAAEQVARAELVRELSPDMEPVLTAADIDSLLARARRVDSSGVAPSEDGWVPTYSLNAAIGRGWRLRASRCFDDIDFGEDGQRFNAAQRHKACLEMARLYPETGSVVLVSPYVV
jgi:hypothetical protein